MIPFQIEHYVTIKEKKKFYNKVEKGPQCKW